MNPHTPTHQESRPLGPLCRTHPDSILEIALVILRKSCFLRDCRECSITLCLEVIYILLKLSLGQQKSVNYV